jgi:hypothetical protein
MPRRSYESSDEEWDLEKEEDLAIILAVRARIKSLWFGAARAQ